MPATYKLIAESVLGSDTSTITFDNIPDTYNDLILLISARGTGATSSRTLQLNFNNNTNANTYSGVALAATGSSISTATQLGTFMSLGAIPAASMTANTFGNTEIYIPNYKSGTVNKQVNAKIVAPTVHSSTALFTRLISGLFNNTTAITRIDLALSGSASFVTNSSFSLYGIKNS